MPKCKNGVAKVVQLVDYNQQLDIPEQPDHHHKGGGGSTGLHHHQVPVRRRSKKVAKRNSSSSAIIDLVPLGLIGNFQGYFSWLSNGHVEGSLSSIFLDDRIHPHHFKCIVAMLGLWKFNLSHPICVLTNEAPSGLVNY